MHPELEQYIKRALLDIDEIPEARKRALNEVASFVSSKLEAGQEADLHFICTHNSRRSQMAQLWAAAAGTYHGIEGVRTYSGGTEATAFNPRAVAAMRRAGFVIEDPGGDNPHNLATYADDGPVMECFSKTYDDPFNPTEGFAAIMTCSEADEACPVVFGAALRVPMPYEDPKVADGTPEQDLTYDGRCMQIATEMLYLFSLLT
jgi:arsenate reductase